MMLDECVSYFKKKPGFDRVFKLMKKQWESYGKVAGFIVLKKPTADEKEVLGRFLHQDYTYPPGLDMIRFKMSAFEEALELTRFRDLDLKAILDGYFQTDIVYNKHEKAAARSKLKELFSKIAQDLDNPQVATWFMDLVESKRSGYQQLVALAKENDKQLQKVVQAIDGAASSLERESFPLAVLAARVSGNPHYFDRNTKAGRLLLQFLACAYDVEVPVHAKGILELYAQAGITPDDISSSVVIKNIDLYSEGHRHPGVAGFNELGEPCVVTLGNLASISRASSRPHVFVFENQMVFSYLAGEQLEDCSLVCTSGQLKVAALKLFEMLDGDVEIYYSGDFDPEGLQICDKLCSRFNNVIPWGFDENLYRQAISRETVSSMRLAKLDTLANPQLMQLGEVIRENGKAGYQENILDFYREDMLRITAKKHR